jgi:hypothetical protein
MGRIVAAIGFLAQVVCVWFALSVCTIGYTCYMHGDRGPYPEEAWIPWLFPMSVFLVFAIRRK